MLEFVVRQEKMESLVWGDEGRLWQYVTIRLNMMGFQLDYCKPSLCNLTGISVFENSAANPFCWTPLELPDVSQAGSSTHYVSTAKMTALCKMSDTFYLKEVF